MKAGGVYWRSEGGINKAVSVAVGALARWQSVNKKKTWLLLIML
jgi:hypothetical protein